MVVMSPKKKSLLNAFKIPATLLAEFIYEFVSCVLPVKTPVAEQINKNVPIKYKKKYK